jgi:hypothetical protein
VFSDRHEILSFPKATHALYFAQSAWASLLTCMVSICKRAVQTLLRYFSQNENRLLDTHAGAFW